MTNNQVTYYGGAAGLVLAGALWGLAQWKKYPLDTKSLVTVVLSGPGGLLAIRLLQLAGSPRDLDRPLMVDLNDLRLPLFIGASVLLILALGTVAEQFKACWKHLSSADVAKVPSPSDDGKSAPQEGDPDGSPPP